MIIIYLVFNFKQDRLLKSIEKERGYIADYYIYGTHLNFTGNIELVDVDGYKISLVLKSNNEEIELKSNIKVDKNNISFKLSENINDGLSLNDLNNGNYYLLLKLSNKDNKKYYSFINSTEYGNLEYYSTTKNSNNKKIDFIYDEDNKTFKISIVKSKLPSDVYDVTIDAGYGKIDPGSSFKLGNNVYYESELSLKVALSLRDYLEQKGYKVLMTRESSCDLDYYGLEGRAVIPNKYKTKLTISIHLNSEEKSMNYGGVEVYTPNDINYAFARNLADHTKNIAHTSYSLKNADKVEDGVYYSYYDDDTIKESTLESLKNNYNPYNIEKYAPTMYMIRETGGKMTKAYVDGRISAYGTNLYYDSNIATETYLIELGYISYKEDLRNIIDNYNLYAKAIGKTIDEYLK